jgi:hypothetical protein
MVPQVPVTSAQVSFVQVHVKDVVSHCIPSQSAATLQCLPSAQAGQGPPQSTSVSVPSLMPSEHVAVTPPSRGLQPDAPGVEPSSHSSAHCSPWHTARAKGTTGQGVQPVSVHPTAGRGVMQKPPQRFRVESAQVSSEPAEASGSLR